MTVESDGLVRLHVDLSVTLAEMRTWRPERIAAFFDGLAKVQAASSAASTQTAQIPDVVMSSATIAGPTESAPVARAIVAPGASSPVLRSKAYRPRAGPRPTDTPRTPASVVAVHGNGEDGELESIWHGRDPLPGSGGEGMGSSLSHAGLELPQKRRRSLA